MPRTFADSLAQDLSTTFFNTNEFAEKVTISRAGQSTANVAVIVDSRMYDSEADESPTNTAVEAIDFDFVASTYKINSLTVDPQVGDKITTANGRNYLVVTVPGHKCFEPTEDAAVIRVHTKRV